MTVSDFASQRHSADAFPDEWNRPVTTAEGLRAAARDLHECGIATCRIRTGEKRPTDAAWTTHCVRPEAYQTRDGIGILTGSLSDADRAGYAVVCVDLDDAQAVALADQYLPPTDMVEGRAGKPRSHRYYLVDCAALAADELSDATQAVERLKELRLSAGPKTVSHKRGDTELLALRGTGAQAVCPPSIHPSGERREWVGGARQEPAVVGYTDLRAACEALAQACGWAAREQSERTHTAPATIDRGEAYQRAVRYVTGDNTPPSIEGAGGDSALWAVALKVVRGFDLGAEAGYEVLRDHFNSRCVPAWDEAALRHKCQDADQLHDDPRYPRGYMMGGTTWETPPTTGPAATTATAPESPKKAPPRERRSRIRTGWLSRIYARADTSAVTDSSGGRTPAGLTA